MCIVFELWPPRHVIITDNRQYWSSVADRPGCMFDEESIHPLWLLNTYFIWSAAGSVLLTHRRQYRPTDPPTRSIHALFCNTEMTITRGRQSIGERGRGGKVLCDIQSIWLINRLVIYWSSTQMVWPRWRSRDRKSCLYNAIYLGLCFWVIMSLVDCKLRRSNQIYSRMSPWFRIERKTSYFFSE